MHECEAKDWLKCNLYYLECIRRQSNHCTATLHRLYTSKEPPGWPNKTQGENNTTTEAEGIGALQSNTKTFTWTVYFLQIVFTRQRRYRNYPNLWFKSSLTFNESSAIPMQGHSGTTMRSTEFSFSLHILNFDCFW